MASDKHPKRDAHEPELDEPVEAPDGADDPRTERPNPPRMRLPNRMVLVRPKSRPTMDQLLSNLVSTPRC